MVTLKFFFKNNLIKNSKGESTYCLHNHLHRVRKSFPSHYLKLVEDVLALTSERQDFLKCSEISSLQRHSRICREHSQSFLNYSLLCLPNSGPSVYMLHLLLHLPFFSCLQMSLLPSPLIAPVNNSFVELYLLNKSLGSIKFLFHLEL